MWKNISEMLRVSRWTIRRRVVEFGIKKNTLMSVILRSSSSTSVSLDTLSLRYKRPVPQKFFTCLKYHICFFFTTGLETIFLSRLAKSNSPFVMKGSFV